MWIRGKLADVLTLNNNRITEDQRYDISHTIDNKVQNFDLVLNDLQFSDENEYSCESSSFLNDKESIITHTLVYLQITSKSSSKSVEKYSVLSKYFPCFAESPSFVEESTSLSTITVNENSNSVLSCFASGKPTPMIRWYRLSQGGNKNIQGKLIFI
jgi:hypothetical protein